MRVHTLASAAIPWRSVRLGPLHFSPFGLASALGLVASMTLARHCATRVGMPGSGQSGPCPEADTIWDAGLFAIFSCFAASRLLLALQSPAAFFRYPLLLLGLPSLTWGGVALAAFAVVLYLRWKRLPLLVTLDIFAAPAALLAAFLELGHWADGSEAGMPTRLPWGVTVAGLPDTLRVHPVALYGMLLSLALTLWLWTVLPQSRVLARRAPSPRDTVQQNTMQAPGRATALALVAGGLAAFVLDMLSLPPVSALAFWLEPGQWVALTAILTGVLLWAVRPLGFADTAHRRTVSPPTPSPLHMEVH